MTIMQECVQLLVVLYVKFVYRVDVLTLYSGNGDGCPHSRATWVSRLGVRDPTLLDYAASSAAVGSCDFTLQLLTTSNSEGAQCLQKHSIFMGVGRKQFWLGFDALKTCCRLL